MEQTFFPVTQREAERQGIQYSSEGNKRAQFPSRLRKLREEKGVSQSILSRVLGVSKSTIGLWETGDTLPDAKAIQNLAKYYEVSADYLLGLVDIQTTDISVAKICEYTCLLPETITELSQLSKNEILMHQFVARIIDDIVTNNDIGRICDYLIKSAQSEILFELTRLQIYEDYNNGMDITEPPNSINKIFDDKFIIPAADARWFYLSTAREMASGHMDQILQNMHKELCEKYRFAAADLEALRKKLWESDDEE